MCKKSLWVKEKLRHEKNLQLSHLLTCFLLHLALPFSNPPLVIARASPVFLAFHSLHLCRSKLDYCYCIFPSVSHLGFQR